MFISSLHPCRASALLFRGERPPRQRPLPEPFRLLGSSEKECHPLGAFSSLALLALTRRARSGRVMWPVSIAPVQRRTIGIVVSENARHDQCLCRSYALIVRSALRASATVVQQSAGRRYSQASSMWPISQFPYSEFEATPQFRHQVGLAGTGPRHFASRGPSRWMREQVSVRETGGSKFSPDTTHLGAGG